MDRWTDDGRASEAKGSNRRAHVRERTKAGSGKRAVVGAITSQFKFSTFYNFNLNSTNLSWLPIGRRNEARITSIVLERAEILRRRLEGLVFHLR